MTEWKLVPVEPTQAMVIAGAAIWGFDDEKAVPVYKAMLAASPGPLWTPAKINPDTWIGTDESGQMVDFLDGKKGAEIERLREYVRQLRLWIECVATDSQLDVSVPRLGGKTGRTLSGEGS